MILRLDPRWPLVWRTPTSVQVGVDPPLVILDPVSDVEERLLAALSVGVSESGLVMIARGRDAERESLMARVAAALESPPTLTPVRTVAVSGPGPFGPELGALLSSCGIRTIGFDTEELPDLAVVVGHHVIAPGLHSHWLRRDVAHLPVLFTDRAVHLGPIVEPGEGPCLLCLELHRRDADGAWPAIASQLLGRDGTSESPLTGREAAVAAARLVIARLHAGPAVRHETLRIEAETGVRSTRTVEPHPECGCRGIAHLVPLSAATPARRGSDWADAGPRATFPESPTR